MPDRRLYEDRSNVVVKDVKDQPPGKYIAFIHGMFGQNAAVTCDGVMSSPGMITLMRDTGKISEAKGVPVCCFSAEVQWAVLDVERVIYMTGAEWEAAKVEDGKSHKKILEDLFGKDGIAQVVVTPEGQPFPIPATPEAIEKYKEATEKKSPYDDSSLYR